MKDSTIEYHSRVAHQLTKQFIIIYHSNVEEVFRIVSVIFIDRETIVVLRSPKT